MKGMGGVARVTKTLASRSSMNPTLILVALVVPLSLTLGFMSSGVPQIFFLGLAGLIVLVGLLQIVGFSIFAPHRLDDHKHVENKLLIAQMEARIGQGDQILMLPDEGGELDGNPLLGGGK